MAADTLTEIESLISDRSQSYTPEWRFDTDDPDIRSPKSVNIHPSGDKYYVNSLEGGRTVVFDFHTQQKLKVIMHEFSEMKDSALWAPASGLFSFNKVSHVFERFIKYCR